MKKTWNRLIIVSFIVLAAVACATIVFLYPYYNEYKVFDGIEAGQWSEVQKTYESLDSQRQQEVQEMLPDYAKHICLEYQTGTKDYIYTVAAYDAINSIDETKTICTKYNIMVNRMEYRDAIEAIYNANQNYNGQGALQANQMINDINLRLDADTKKEVVIEVLNEKYQQFAAGGITAEEMTGYIGIVNNLSVSDISDYVAVLGNNIQVIQTYRELYDTAQNAYETGDYLTALNICESVQLDPLDSQYIEKYYSLYNLAYTTGMNYYDSLLDTYIEIGDNENALNLLTKLEKYYSDDMNLQKFKLSMAKDWQKAYVKLAENADSEIQKALGDTEDGINILDSVYKNIKPDSMLLYDVDEDGVPEVFFYNSMERNETYVSCFIFTYRDGAVSYLGYAKVRSFCSDSSFVAFPWYSTRVSGDEYCLKRYADGVLTDGPYVQNVDGTYYVNEQVVDETEYLSQQSETLATSLNKGVKDFETATLDDSESYILAYQNKQ